MIQVRNNVFETNSSSSHAFVICPSSMSKDDMHYDIDDLFDRVRWSGEGSKYGVYRAKTEEFGRYPFRILFLPEDKADYAIANRMDTELEAELNYLYRNCDSEDCLWKIDRLKRDGVKKILVAKGNGWGVDELKLKSWLESNGVSFHDYLTDRKYVVICDGDEYGYFGCLVEMGMISKDAKIIR